MNECVYLRKSAKLHANLRLHVNEVGRYALGCKRTKHDINTSASLSAPL